MPYAVIENMYSSLTIEKQKEVYDYLCFLVSTDKKNEVVSPESSYHKGFFDLFGINSDFPEEPVDMPPALNEDELF